MGKLLLFPNFIFVLIIICTCLYTTLLLMQIYFTYISKKLILKVYKKNISTIFWIIAITFWVFFFVYDIKMNIIHKDLLQFTFHILMMEMCLLNLLSSIRSSQLRESGLYIFIWFYQWSKIKDYNWIAPNLIEFKINTLFKNNRKFKVIVNLKDEERLKLNSILGDYIK